MLFADDTLVFGGAKSDHLHYLCAIFLCFQDASILKIKLVKSEIIHVGTVENVDGSIMGCGVSSLPLKYLDLLLEASFKAKSI
jgi:hypothetical protein